MATGLKFRIKEEAGLFYLCVENNGAVHLCGYHTADLRLWFCISKIQVSRLIYTVQAVKRLYPSRSRSNKKRIKFLAKPTQNPRKIHATSTLLPRYFNAYSSLDSVRFHACSTLSKTNHAQRKKITFMKKKS